MQSLLHHLLGNVNGWCQPKKKTPTAVLIYLLSGAKKIYTVGNIYSRAQQNNSILQREKKVGRQREQDRERYTDRRRERERETQRAVFCWVGKVCPGGSWVSTHTTQSLSLVPAFCRHNKPCVCVCIWQREREKERESDNASMCAAGYV